MDTKCPKCHLDLKNAPFTYGEPKMQGIMATFIEKRPIICLNCSAELQINEYKLKRLNHLLTIIFYILAMIANSSGLINLSQTFIIMVVFILSIWKFEKIQLKDKPMYSLYEAITEKEIKSNYFSGLLIIFILIFVILFSCLIMLALFLS